MGAMLPSILSDLCMLLPHRCAHPIVLQLVSPGGAAAAHCRLCTQHRNFLVIWIMFCDVMCVLQDMLCCVHNLRCGKVQGEEGWENDSNGLRTGGIEMDERKWMFSRQYGV